MTTAELHRIFLECNSICTDTRKLNKDDIFFALKGDNFNGNTYAQNALDLGAKYVVIDEPKFDKSPKAILVSDVLETLQNLASFHRNYLNIPIIALTGSNGKTTTKELINNVISKKYKTRATVGNLNNHIGVPLTLLSMTSTTEIGIVEMGANHLNEIASLCKIAQPNYGYITNFGKAHLEGFGGIDGVIKGKSEMYDYLIANNATIFVNGTDSIQKEKTKVANRFVFNSTNSDVTIKFLEAKPFVTCNYQQLHITSHLVGDYNFNNIAAAIAIGHYFKVKDTDIKSAIETYIPSNNRSQIITIDTNKIILDAYNANPTSMLAALSNFEKQDGYKIAILGDMFELGSASKEEHQKILELTKELNIDEIFLVGEHFFNTNTNSDKVQQYKTFSDFQSHFNINKFKNTTFLIKGSRGMALERILELNE